MKEWQAAPGGLYTGRQEDEPARRSGALVHL